MMTLYPFKCYNRRRTWCTRGIYQGPLAFSSESHGRLLGCTQQSESPVLSQLQDGRKSLESVTETSMV